MLLASASVPHWTKSLYEIVSARINPRSKSLWMTPAALGAVHPLRIVQARVSLGPLYNVQRDRNVRSLQFSIARVKKNDKDLLTV